MERLAKEHRAVNIKAANARLQEVQLGCEWDPRRKYLWFYATTDARIDVPESVYGYPTLKSIPDSVIDDAVRSATIP